MLWNVGKSEGRLLPYFLTLFFGESLTKANLPSDRYDYAECQASAGLPIIPYPDF
jgi:hypothetical protein